MTTTEKFPVRNRFTGEIQFEASIEVTPDMTPRFKIGLAVKWARKNGADLGGADLGGADLGDAYLGDAYLGDAYLRDAYLAAAYLDGAYLGGADLRDAYLDGAYLRGADLRGADLRGADLRDAYLGGAYLDGAYLGGAYLDGAYWIPKIKNIHSAVYQAASAKKALDMSTWHTDGFCGTTHCRAGWVNHLACERGRVLEGVYGPSVAAALIYMASDPTMDKIPDWGASNEDALADMKRLADLEVAA